MEMEKAAAKRAQVEAEHIEHIRKEEQNQEQESVDREAEFDH
jgi:hypothetical protein